MKYECFIGDEFDEDYDYESVFNKIEGIPIECSDTVKYGNTDPKALGFLRPKITYVPGNWKSTELTKENIFTMGVVTTENIDDVFPITAKQLVQCEFTTDVGECGIAFSYTLENTKQIPKYTSNKFNKFKCYIVNDELSKVVTTTEDDPEEKEIEYSTYMSWSVATEPEAEYPSDHIFQKEVVTTIVYRELDFASEEETGLTYYHRLSSNTYECIKITNPHIEWFINPNLGNQHDGSSLTGLAPDSNMYMPIISDVVKHLSFEESVVVYDYSFKQHWTYWHSENKSWWTRHRGYVWGILQAKIEAIGILFAFGEYGDPLAVIIATIYFCLRVWQIFDQDAPKWVSVAVTVIQLAGVIYSGVSSIAAGGGSISAVDALMIGANVVSIVFNVCFSLQQQKYNDMLSSEQQEYKEKSTTLQNTVNLNTNSSGNIATLANTLTHGVACGYEFSTITDMMRTVIYPSELVYATMESDLDVYVTITNGTAGVLYV